MSKRYKSISIFSLIIGFIFLCSFIFIPFIKINKSVFAEEGNNLLYAFVSKQEGIEVKGKIYVDFGLSIDVGGDGEITRSDAETMVKNKIAPFESAKIYLRTRNISAISEEGDYEAIDQIFTVFGDNPFTSIAVKINNVGLQVGNVARQFCVEIYKIEITGLKEGYDSKELHEIREISSKTLSTGAGFSIGQKKYTVSYAGNGFNVGDNLNILDLGYYSYLAPETLCFDVNENTSFNDIKIDLANISNGWYNKIKYLSDHDMLKLGIRVSMLANEAPNGIYTDNSFVGVQILGGNASGVGVPTFNEDGPTNKLYSSASVVELARWFAKFQSNETESLAISKAFNGEFEDVTVGTLFNENILLSEKLIEKEYGSNYDFGQGGVYDDYIVENAEHIVNTFLIDDLGSALKGSTTISTRVWSYLSGKDKFYSGYTNFVPINYQARVESATFGQIYKDQDGKEKVGVSLRFSEPVQITKNKDGNLKTEPRIQGQLNGSSSLAITFDYSSGDGTDTLYFEADVSTIETHITRISLTGATGFESVYDFAPNSATGGGSNGNSQHLNVMDKNDKASVNGWEKNIAHRTYICSYDLCIPNVRMNGEPTKQVKTSHTILINPENISETGKIFYAWITESEKENGNEPKNLSSVPVSAQSSQMIFSPPNISGKRYLYIYAVSELGKKSEVVKYGPLHFDNDKPTLEVKKIDDGYKQKEFEITITNKSLIENFEKFAELKNNLKLFVASDAEGSNIEYEFPVLIKDVEQLTKESVKVFPTLTAEQLELQQESEKEYGEYYIFFSISDALENQGVSQPISCYFDVRDIFSVKIEKNDFEMDEFTKGKLNLDKNYYTLDLSKIGEGKTLEFSTNELTSISIDTFVNVYNIDEDVSANLTGKDNNDGTIEISINQKVEPGLYSLVLKDKASGSNKKTLPIYFYVTNGKDKESGLYQEKTGGYQAVINNVAFTNKVFQLPSSVSYYYKNADDTVVKQNYGNGNRPIFFSSKDIAYSYIRYREYLDLYAVTLTPTLANYLNSGSASEHRKADGVTQKAETGQVWIRYKEMNWQPETTINDWVYYYYGADSSALPIKVKNIGGELERALDTVSRMICSYGEELDLVTEEYLDNYGAPTIRADQMRLMTESSEDSICGTLFAEPALYLGDTGIHFPLEAGVPLSSNIIIPFGENRRFYYKSSGDEYRDLIMDSRETFGEYINETGKFTILEIDENGVCEYYVYIDKSAPKLKLSWTATKEENETLDEKNGNSRTIYGNNFCIEGIEDEDTLSFVAIYRYTNQGEGDLLHVRRKSDFEKDGSFPLDDGKYYIQVSDRSGNSYVFILQAKSTPLEFTVKEVDNSYIRVELNREEEEVRYQVYLDNKLLTTDYREKRFTESGIYRFIIEDDYGNRHEETYEFTRDIPQVSWSYQTSDGSYKLYDKDVVNEKILIEKEDDQNYIISTSTYLRFTLSTGCDYEVLSGNPNPNKNIYEAWVTLGNKTPFTIKFYYQSEPSTYVIYSCRIDDVLPQISVSYEQKYYKPFEITEIEKNLANGTYKLGKDEDGKEELYKIYDFTPTSIGFAVDKDAFGAEKSTTLYVANGQKVQSKYFKVEVSDENGVKEVKIYCDGKLVITKESDFSNIYLSRRGAYQIVATDNFGNTTTFSFVNDYEERVEYFVDGEKMSTDVPFADNFGENGYEKVEYGKSQAEIKILSSAEVHYIITDADGTTYYFGFVAEGGKLYNFQYLVKIVKGEKVDENGKVIAVDEIESISARGITPLVSGEIAKISKGVAIYLSTNNDGTLLLSVRSTDTEQNKYTVETRVSPLENQTEMPYYFKTEISTIPSFVEFIDKDEKPIESAQTIKVNEPFAIRNTLGEEIQSVQIAYSQTGTYVDYKAVVFGSYFEEEGMYHVKVINRYGVQTDYYVVLSSQFLMSATIKYIGGETIEYSKDYTKEYNDFYSNFSVEIFVYATNVKVFLNDEEISGEPTEQGYSSIYIKTPGTYRLRVEDEFGNVQEKKIVINEKDLELDENLLTNFNENALRRDENYTNQEIFLNKKVIDESEIAFISMTYGDRTITILDKISEVKKAFDENQSIGTSGKDGEYTLLFKDLYGNKAQMIIYYCSTPTLTIVRNTLNGVNAEMFSPLEILQDGVWTNDKVSFFISATKYVLKVDGKENVKSIDYDTKTKDEYEVEYLDEYGFKYSFTVHLCRKEIVIQPAENMSISKIADMSVTKDSVQILFTENASCVYTLNNGPEEEYKVGNVLYKDGVYRFKAVDKAGNISTYTVKKDSAVEYRLEGGGANEILVNGSVTNSHSVKFYAENADNAYIKKVFHNNQFIEYDEEIFTERGKWELIVADDVGNESYFRFYILYGKMDGFTYNTPYNYKIISVYSGMVNVADMVVKEQGLRLEATENGTYAVTMESLNPYDVISFTFTVDNTPPQAELVGCKQNEKTINNITLKGCAVGDTVYVYKDGKLVKTVRIDSDYMDPPTISEAGKYKIIVENEAGLQKEFSFERKYVPNVAGSVLIILFALASVVGLFVGLIWRNHSKTDD